LTTPISAACGAACRMAIRPRRWPGPHCRPATPSRQPWYHTRLFEYAPAMTRPHSRPRRQAIAELLGLMGMLMGGGLLAGHGGQSLARSIATAGPVPLPLRTSRTQAPVPIPQRPENVTALDRNLMTAAALGDLDLVNKLLAAGASPLVADERGRTALLSAI